LTNLTSLAGTGFVEEANAHHSRARGGTAGRRVRWGCSSPHRRSAARVSARLLPAATSAISRGPTTEPPRLRLATPSISSIPKYRIRSCLDQGSSDSYTSAAYSARHYGRATYRLVDPKVIVEHYTETSTAQAAYNTFAIDRPDPELHELPNVCAHFPRR
jgi:hypothetical protein